MKRAVFLCLLCAAGSLTFGVARVSVDECESLTAQLRLPVKLKTRGKPARARWEQVDVVVSKLRESLPGKSCAFTFGQVFRSDKKEVYFPLTNNLVRTVPEEALKSIKVFSQEGYDLGEYEGRVAYERSGGLYVKNAYRLYYFQFKDKRGELQSTGNRLLLDNFVARWDDLKDRVLISTQ